MGAYVEKTLDVVAPNHMQQIVGCLSHHGFQEHTHSSPTPGSRSLECCEVSASTLNCSTVDDKQESPVKAFKRLVDNQQGFSNLYPNSPDGQLDNLDELFGKLKSKLFDIDFLQTIRDDLITLFEIQGFVFKLRKQEVPSPIVDVVLDLEPVIEQVFQVVRQK